MMANRSLLAFNKLDDFKLWLVSNGCVLLENPSIVYETGAFSTKEWENAEKLPNELYVQINCIESFGIVK